MNVKVDSVGRILIPKELRDRIGMTPGTTVDISFYGEGLTVVVGGRGGRLVEEDGRLVITGDTVFTDEEMYRLIDEGRR